MAVKRWGGGGSHICSGERVKKSGKTAVLGWGVRWGLFAIHLIIIIIVIIIIIHIQLPI